MHNSTRVASYVWGVHAWLSKHYRGTGWIQAITDTPPSVEAPALPIYHVNATANPTGTMKAYKPKGDWWNPKQRNWLKYERWQPPQPPQQ